MRHIPNFSEPSKLFFRQLLRVPSGVGGAPAPVKVGNPPGKKSSDCGCSIEGRELLDGFAEGRIDIDGYLLVEGLTDGLGDRDGLKDEDGAGVKRKFTIGASVLPFCCVDGTRLAWEGRSDGDNGAKTVGTIGAVVFRKNEVTNEAGARVCLTGSSS